MAGIFNPIFLQHANKVANLYIYLFYFDCITYMEKVGTCYNYFICETSCTIL
jgi:hypothetical protein